MKIFIPYEFVSWNDYIRVERGNKYQANYIKQSEKMIVRAEVTGKYRGTYPITLAVRPYFHNKRRDLDNYRIKGLVDGLVCAGVIKNDNLNCINKIIIEPIFTDEEGVEIEITPAEGA